MKKPENPKFKDKIDAIKIAEQENINVKPVKLEIITDDIQWNNEKIKELTNIDSIIESERFWKLDFSKSEPEFREKNMKFFEELEKVYNVYILTNSNWDIDYYTLIQFFNEKHNEYIIPLPVFEDILHLNKPEISDEQKNEYCEDEDLWEDYYPEFEEYMSDEYNLTVDSFDSRYEWDENWWVDDYAKSQRTINKLKNWEDVSQEEINHFIYLNKWNKENTWYNEEVLNYWIPPKGIIKYCFYDTYNNWWIMELKKSEEILWEELKEFYKTTRVEKIKDYSYYWNLSEWAREYASDELENRFEKVELYKVQQKEKLTEYEFIWSWKPEKIDVNKDNYIQYIRIWHLGWHYINWEHFPWNNEENMAMRIIYKEISENEA